MIGADLQHPLETFDRLIQFAAILVDNSQADVGLGRIGPDLHRMFITGQGAVGLSLLPKDVAEIDLGFEIIAVAIDRAW